jgi:hypothetical protein
VILDVYSWMCLNADRIVEAVRTDGGHMDGPNCAPLLEEAFRCNSPGRTRDKARELLRVKLEKAGFKGLLS